MGSKAIKAAQIAVVVVCLLVVLFIGKGISERNHELQEQRLNSQREKLEQLESAVGSVAERLDRSLGEVIPEDVLSELKAARAEFRESRFTRGDANELIEVNDLIDPRKK